MKRDIDLPSWIGRLSPSVGIKLMVWLMSGLCLTLLPGTIQAASQCRVSQAKAFVFQVTSNNGRELKARTRFLLKEKNGTVYWHYRHRRDDVCWNVTTDRMARPIQVSYSEGRDFMHVVFRKDGALALQGVWDGQPVERAVTISGNLTAEVCMPARMLCREGSESYTFKLLRSEKFPELKTYRMRLEVMGQEEVRVPAGSFDCLKVRLTPVSQWLKPFYQGYLYISRDMNRYIVRMSNIPKGYDYELESIRDLPIRGRTVDCVPEPSRGWEQPELCQEPESR